KLNVLQPAKNDLTAFREHSSITHLRNDEIEVLRAIAVVFIVFSHLGFLPAWHDSEVYSWITERFTFWTGVDLFFCISGYVITSFLLPKLDGVTGTYFWAQAVAFWIRRWFRIIPSAWAWIGIILLLTILFNRAHSFGHFQRNAFHAIAAMLNIENFNL